MRQLITGTALTLAVLLGSAACGGGDETVEKAIEAAAGGDANVEVDSDGDGIQFETEEGSYSAGDMAEMPDGFPSDIPLPDGLPLVAATSSSNNWTVTYLASELPDGYCDEYLGEFESAGFEESSRFESSGDFTVFYETEQYSITVSCQPSTEAVVVGVLDNGSS